VGDDAIAVVKSIEVMRVEHRSYALRGWELLSIELTKRHARQFHIDPVPFILK
jgi:hypothetical protein